MGNQTWMGALEERGKSYTISDLPEFSGRKISLIEKPPQILHQVCQYFKNKGLTSKDV